MAGLHAAREQLGLAPQPQQNQNVAGQGPTSAAAAAQQQFLNLAGHDASGQPMHKPLALSPRNFGMEDLRDFVAPLGSFSTGLTPRSGFTPRLHTGFTPRAGGPGPAHPHADTNAFFSRNTGFSPRQGDTGSKISPTGFTPKDVSGMKVPMRFPGQFTNSPPKPGMMMMDPMQQMRGMHGGHMGSPEMNAMNVSMYEFLNRPLQPSDARVNVSPLSDKADSNQEDLDERRRMKNRERVRKCRKRKQDRLNFLEDRTAELEKENGNLKAKMARKSTVKAEPLTEAQIKELRKKQNTTLAMYIRAFNESDAAFEAGARSIWCDGAEIIYGHGAASRVRSVDAIIANKKDSAAVFSSFKIKQYDVLWKPNSNNKCCVNWEVEVTLKENAPVNVPMTAPFGVLAHCELKGELLSFQMTSHLTFEEGKVVEEVRHVNPAKIADLVLQKFAQDPVKAASTLKVLLSA